MQEQITYKSCKTAPTESMPLIDVFNKIKNGAVQMRVLEHQKRMAEQGDDSIKLELPVFILPLCHEGTNGSANDVKRQYGYMCFDIDHLTKQEYIDTREAIMEKLKPMLVALFRSPSGDGIKFILKTNYIGTDADVYRWVYNKIKRELVKNCINVPLDKTCDITRPCFLSFDEDMYIATNPTTVDVGKHVEDYQAIPDSIIGETNMSQEGRIEFKRRLSKMMGFVNKWGRHNFMYTMLCNLRKCGGNYENAKLFLESLNDKGLTPRNLQYDVKRKNYLRTTWKEIIKNQKMDPINLFIDLPEPELDALKKSKIQSIFDRAALRGVRQN